MTKAGHLPITLLEALLDDFCAMKFRNRFLKKTLIKLGDQNINVNYYGVICFLCICLRYVQSLDHKRLI